MNAMGLKTQLRTPEPEAAMGRTQPSEATADAALAIKSEQQYSERLSAISHFTVEIASHLNNSLTPIICYAQMLEQASCTPAQGTKLRKITEAAYRAKEVIDGLMAFADEQPVRVRRIDLNELVRETVVVARDLLWLPENQVSLELSPEHPTILGDPHQISQAVLHLLRNAMQAARTSGAGTELLVRTFLNNEGKAGVEVVDRGHGIPQEILPKILLPFFTTRPDEGAGLGLSIVHGITEAHGGEIGIETREGNGTAVKLSFPAVATAPMVD
ncbi:MAG: hypothetical protein HUU16_03545 [Candidatus Omnitrophica bacterium]|nr:hypothetical protein [Candidatus Omnitrophota bacterium]